MINAKQMKEFTLKNMEEEEKNLVPSVNNFLEKFLREASKCTSPCYAAEIDESLGCARFVLQDYIQDRLEALGYKVIIREEKIEGQLRVILSIRWSIN